MRLTCFECGATGPATAFAADTDARACMELIAKAPAGTGPALIGYLALFRPGTRALAWGRARKLLEALRALMDAPTVKRGHREFAAPPDLWRRALEQMAAQRAKLALPLKSHGYLLEILAGLAEKAAQPETPRDPAPRGASMARAAENLGAMAVRDPTFARVLEGAEKHKQQAIAEAEKRMRREGGA